MALQQVVKGVGGTIEAEFLGGLPASCTVTLKAVDQDPDSSTYGDLKTKVSSAAATLDQVSTTLAFSAAKGARQVSVTSAVGVVAGRRYKVGAPGGAEPDENVRVLSVSGSTVKLTGPLAFDHAPGVAFKGLRASYAVTSVQADACWADGYAVWTPASGDPITEAPVDCVQAKIPEVLADLTDLRQVEPKADALLDLDFDLYGALREARDNVLLSLGPDRIRAVFGASLFRRAVALRLLIDAEHSFGPQWAEDAKRWRESFGEELAKLRSYLPADKDNDGKPNESNADDQLRMFAL